MPTNDTHTIGKRLAGLVKAGQEPQDRLWAAIYVLIVVALLIGLVTILYAESARNAIANDRELGFERGAVACLQVVIDNDRTFELPSYCGRAEVLAYYPPGVCKEFFSEDATCGDKWLGP